MRHIIANFDSGSFRRFIKFISLAVTGIDTKHWGEHNLNVSCLQFATARAYGLPFHVCDQYGMAAYLHDLGKHDPRLVHLFVPGKPKYTDEERVLSKQHPVAGVEMYHELLGALNARGMERLRGYMERLFNPQTITIVTDCMIHHETDFSEGGESIPLVGRICRIVDAYDTMRAPEDDPCRLYRKKEEIRTPAEARVELVRCSGTDFDPKLVELFISKVLMHPLPRKPRNSGKKKKPAGTLVVGSTSRKYKASPLPVC